MCLVVFGSGGMLGKAITKAARDLDLQTLALSHSDCDISDVNVIRALCSQAQSGDVWINCAGVLRSDQYGYAPRTDHEMIVTNASGPFNLAASGIRLVHFSTDSVFSGVGPAYLKSILSKPDPNDLYGLTKLVGEQIATQPHVTVIRTSFMGLGSGLMRLALDCANSSHRMTGHAHSYWSGSAVIAVARATMAHIAANTLPPGLQHLATPSPISKADALRSIARAFSLDLEIVDAGDPYVYRGLVPTLPLQPFDEAVEEYAVAVRSK